MPNALLAQLQDAARRKDREDLTRKLDEVRSHPDLDAFDLLVAGIEVKEAGFYDLGEQVFVHLIERHPQYAAGWYELGVVYRFSGRRQMAIQALLKAVEYSPHDFRYRTLLANLLFVIGARPEAEAHLALLRPGNPSEEEEVAVLADYGRYVTEVPHGRAQHLVDEVKRRYAWIGTGDLASRISAAIDERRGFALIRLGDGEGAFARVGPADEAEYPALYRWFRNDWVRFLFGPHFDPVSTGYEALTQTLMDTVAQADVLGVPYPSWVIHEYSISSIRGVPCLMNIHRHLLSRPPARRPALCDQIVHIHLHNEGLIEPILRKAKALTVISCLTGLPELVKSRFDLEEVDFITIPREYTAPHLQDASHVQGESFPGIFNETMQRLRRPHEGRVFIVAAGTLGKFYAAVIKQHGGIALDLGSLVDGWMRLPSRAGYGDELAL